MWHLATIVVVMAGGGIGLFPVPLPFISHEACLQYYVSFVQSLAHIAPVKASKPECKEIK